MENHIHRSSCYMLHQYIYIYIWERQNIHIYILSLTFSLSLSLSLSHSLSLSLYIYIYIHTCIYRERECDKEFSFCVYRVPCRSDIWQKIHLMIGIMEYIDDLFIMEKTCLEPTSAFRWTDNRRIVLKNLPQILFKNACSIINSEFNLLMYWLPYQD